MTAAVAGPARWITLLAATRVLAAAAAILLLAAHRVTDFDATLGFVTVGWTAVTLGAFTRSPAVARSKTAWAIDALGALVLIRLTDDWRSPFYVFALTTLILPATTLRFRAAFFWAAAFTAAYLVVALLTERLPEATLRSTIRLETIATHLMVPFVITLSLAYASRVLRQLADERARGERLAVEAERRRIAWELHDSAKQRIHAAHLVLTALPPLPEGRATGLVDQALSELSAAASEMQNSVSELHEPLDGRPVDELLRERASQLRPVTTASIEVRGALPPLSPLVATHVFRIAAEALTNAVRHAEASHIEAVLSTDGGDAIVEVRDDGSGLGDIARPGSNGLRSMQGRARAIGAALSVASEDDGTVVALRVPVGDVAAAPR